MRRDDLEEIFAVIDKVPFLGSLKRDISNLRRVLHKRRAPRLLAFGSEEVVASRVLNALLSDRALPEEALSDAWVNVESADCRVDWLELAPRMESESAITNTESAAEAPDIALLLFTPAEAANASLELQTIERLLGKLTRRPAVLPLIIADDKAGDHQGAREALTKELTELKVRSHPAMTIALPRSGATMGVADLAELVTRSLPDDARVEAARAFEDAEEARAELGTMIVRSCATIAMTVSLMPVPLSDIAFIAPLQVMMVNALAYLSGRKWDKRMAAEWIGSVGVVAGAGFGMRFAAQQVVKLAPGIGSAVSAGIAATGTTALGRAAMGYFLTGRDELAVAS